jgi:hypothetical protein
MPVDEMTCYPHWNLLHTPTPTKYEMIANVMSLGEMPVDKMTCHQIFWHFFPSDIFSQHIKTFDRGITHKTFISDIDILLSNKLDCLKLDYIASP